MTQGLASAVFDSDAEAQSAVAELRAQGVPDSALSVITQQRGRAQETTGDGEITQEDHGNLTRGILGGGLLGAGLAVAALAIPGVGPLVAAGAIAATAVPGAAAVGAVVGAAAGTLNEALKKHGVEDDDAEYYGSRIEEGGVFVSVSSSAEIDSGAAREILYANGGHSAARARATI